MTIFITKEVLITKSVNTNNNSTNNGWSYKKIIISKTFKLCGMKTNQPLVHIKILRKVGMLSAFFYDESLGKKELE